MKTTVSLILLLAVLVLGGGALATHEPTYQDRDSIDQPPSTQHWFGTDDFGRDLWSRFIVGARWSLSIGIAAAAHQGWSANLFTTASDMFPKQAVGSVVGIGGMAGAIGGMFISKLVGWILDATGSYVPIFIMAATAYLFALLVIHLLAPKLEPAKID